MMVKRLLLPHEMRLFLELSRADQRHAMQVLNRFDALQRHASVVVRRAALLHDIGKVEVGLGTFSRVVATLVGRHGQRFRRYHEHESRGAELLERAGSDPVTVGFLRGVGDSAMCEALRRADEI